MKKNIAVFGLGSMGYGIAQSLLRAGHQTRGFDVTQSQVDKLVSEGGVAGDLSNGDQHIDIVIVVVLNADQTRSVLLDEGGCLSRLQPGACVIACATVPPDFAREMERYEMKGVTALVFNTHGEGLGRGGHPGTIKERVDYAMSPWVLKISEVTFFIPYLSIARAK